MNRPITLSLAAIAFVISTSSAGTVAFAQGLLTQYFPIPVALMKEAALTAIATCAAKGDHVVASIYDSNAIERILFVSDHTVDRHHLIELARRKAYTALNGGQLSSQLMKTWAAPDNYPPAGDAGYMLNGPPGGLRNITLPGGAGIKINQDAIAGLGVAGASTPEQDEACAVAGVAKIQARLNQLQSRIDPLKAQLKATLEAK